MAGVPPKRGEAYTFYISVTSQADVNVFQANPTIAAGDFQYSNDGGATFANPFTPPVVTAGNNRVIEVALSAAEMTPSAGDKILFWGHDQIGAEWQDYGEELTTVTTPLGELIAAILNALVGALMTIAPIARILRSMDLQLYRGDTWTQPIARLGDISGRDKLWITCKDDKGDADSQAIFQIEETAGLVYIVGAAAGVPANGSITVTDAAVGNITVVLAAVETAKIEATKQFFYDVQMLDGTTVTTLRAGYLMVTSDVTKVVA